MFAIVIALVVLAVAVAAIYLLLKNMGEEGIEVAAPGSCKSGRCGVQCAPKSDARDEPVEVVIDETDEVKRQETV
jgi:hypothetical protein